jgi:integrase
MPRPKKSVPSYLHHKPTNQAYVRLPDENGGRKPVYLGPYDSPESRAEYARIVQELSVSPILKSAGLISTGRSDVSVNEVLLAYIEHAEKHYCGPDGHPTREAQHIKVVCRYVRELCGHTPAPGFGPLALKAVRQKFIAAGWCRRSVNQQTERMRWAFRWAAGEELIPFEVYHRLTAVSGLQCGRTEARETEPVRPVDDAIVDATLHHLNRHVRSLVEFQRLTGCRPGEACLLRRCDIEIGGNVWLYRPPSTRELGGGNAVPSPLVRRRSNY